MIKLLSDEKFGCIELLPPELMPLWAKKAVSHVTTKSSNNQASYSFIGVGRQVSETVIDGRPLGTVPEAWDGNGFSHI